MALRRVLVVNSYSVFTFEPLLVLLLLIFKLVKDCSMNSCCQTILGLIWLGSKQIRLLKSKHRYFETAGSQLVSSKVVKSFQELIYSSPGYESNGWIGIFTGPALRGTLEVENRRALEKVFSFLGTISYWITEHEETAPITRVQTQYRRIVYDGSKDMKDRACSKEKLGSRERKISSVQKMLVETFDEHCSTDLRTLKYHFLDRKAENIRSFRTLPVLYGGLHEHVNVHNKQAFRNTLQTKRRQMMDTVKMMKRN